MANDEKKIQNHVVEILMNPRTKEYRTISSDRILVNGITLGEILTRIETLEDDFNVTIRLLKAQVNALKNVAETSQIATNGKIANMENSIKKLGGKL